MGVLNCIIFLTLLADRRYPLCKIVLVLNELVLVLVIEKLADRLRAPPMAEHEQEHETSGRSQHETA